MAMTPPILKSPSHSSLAIGFRESRTLLPKMATMELSKIRKIPFKKEI
jgi:hypothetical protein